MKKNSYILTPAFVLLALSGHAQTTLIDDNFDNNDIGSGGTNGGFVGVEIGGTQTGFTLTESGTEVTHTATGTNNISGIFSINSFDPTAYSEFTATWVVNGYDNPAGGGAFNLALTSAASLTTPQVLFRFEQANLDQFTLDVNDGTDSAILVTDPISNAESRDGFTLSATFNQTGISYVVTNLATLDDSVGTIAYGVGLSYSDLFDSTTHVGAYTQASGGADTSFIIDQVTVAAVIPEPSSYSLIAGLLGFSYIVTRRRQA